MKTAPSYVASGCRPVSHSCDHPGASRCVALVGPCCPGRTRARTLNSGGGRSRADLRQERHPSSPRTARPAPGDPLVDQDLEFPPLAGGSFLVNPLLRTAMIRRLLPTGGGRPTALSEARKVSPVLDACGRRHRRGRPLRARGARGPGVFSLSRFYVQRDKIGWT